MATGEASTVRPPGHSTAVAVRALTTRLGWVVAAVAIGVAVSGCATGGLDRASDPAAISAPGTPPATLLTSVGGDGAFEALVRGRIGINERGCVTVGNARTTYLLVAPAGSTMSTDGERVRLAGVGDFAIGDHVETGGGYFVPRGADQRGCLTGDEADQEVALITP